MKDHRQLILIHIYQLNKNVLQEYDGRRIQAPIEGEQLYDSKIYFEWEPITYNSSFACYCGYLNYHSDVLIFIYKEKHDAYVVSINKMEVRYFNYNGERYCVGKDLIYYEEYLNMNNGVIGVLSIPDLNVQPNISKEDLTALGLEIVSI